MQQNSATLIYDVNTIKGTVKSGLKKLVVIKDYESAFDAVTLIQIP